MQSESVHLHQFIPNNRGKSKKRSPIYRIRKFLSVHFPKLSPPLGQSTF